MASSEGNDLAENPVKYPEIIENPEEKHNYSPVDSERDIVKNQPINTEHLPAEAYQPKPELNAVSPGNQAEYMSYLYNDLHRNPSKNDRKGFIKKVYSLLSIQLSFTFIFIGIIVGVPALREGIKETLGLFYASLVITILLVIAIMCFKKVARRYPINYIALFTFTIFESYILAFVSSYYNPYVVLSAVILTFVVTISLTIYAFKTKSDFTLCGGALVAVSTSLLMFGILLIFFHSFYVHMIFCEIVIVIYSVFIIYDTQLIAGGRYNEISFDDYVIGALMLYVDVVGLFIYIMSLLGSKSN